MSFGQSFLSSPRRRSPNPEMVLQSNLGYAMTFAGKMLPSFTPSSFTTSSFIHVLSDLDYTQTLIKHRTLNKLCATIQQTHRTTT